MDGHTHRVVRLCASTLRALVLSVQLAGLASVLTVVETGPNRVVVREPLHVSGGDGHTGRVIDELLGWRLREFRLDPA